jgi:SAM-dependent methyltransferase
MMRTDSRYWDDIAAGDDPLPAGWREYARDMHLDLFQRWIGRHCGRWLKTDLFEELNPSRALVPKLAGAQWVGLDLSSRGAREADVPGMVRLVADVRDLPLRDGTFDGVLSTSTLDHFAAEIELRQALRELHRVVRPGGLLFLTLDNPQNPLVRARNLLPARLGRATGLAPFYVGRTLSQRRGRRALKDAGFLVEASTHLLHVPFVVGTRLARYRWYATRVLPRFDRLGGTRLAPFTGHFVAFLAMRPSCPTQP